MASSWRSWFWNSAMFAVALPGACIFAGVVVYAGRHRGFDSRALIVFAFGAVVFWIAAARAPFLGVWARPRGIVLRWPMWTVTIPWAEVVRVTAEPILPAPVDVGGATLAVIIRRRPGRGEERVELGVLRGYGGSKLAERAVEGLNAHLRRWRQRSR
jgi:hypothetical protein